ncbi:segregation/condensation protein A [Rheinheimera texasensis]|uniref:segregation and condensation protein A n=1 Tax=Rheinheimera texasensis TaxID=306205 RepID=UPI0032B1DEA4
MSLTNQTEAETLSSLTVQQVLPLAFVRGEAVLERPEDLFIPPDALEVLLEAFEGPLDFLLYLIRRHKFDIVDLPVNEITLQYMEYINLMQELNFELAAEYLVMAAMLAEIKSRLLLPKREAEQSEEVDPRAELVRRLQEYEQFKLAATQLDAMPRQERDFFQTHAALADNFAPYVIEPEVSLAELVLALQDVFKRTKDFQHHQIKKEQLSTRERMSRILELLRQQPVLAFGQCFAAQEGRQGVVVTFLAVLELVKEKLITLTQVESYGQIHLKLA